MSLNFTNFYQMKQFSTRQSVSWYYRMVTFRLWVLAVGIYYFFTFVKEENKFMVLMITK